VRRSIRVFILIQLLNNLRFLLISGNPHFPTRPFFARRFEKFRPLPGVHVLPMQTLMRGANLPSHLERRSTPKQPLLA